MHARIFQVDAFSRRRFAGNPAAVVPLRAFPADEVMQAVAAENNLSETAFIVPLAGEYRIRWFTPSTEVPLCGHATLASGAVVMERLEPGRSHVVFECALGPLTVRRTEHGFCLNLPARPMAPYAAAVDLAGALGIAPREVWADRDGYLALLDSAESVRALQPDLRAVAALDRVGLIVTAAGDGSHDFTSRYFTPQRGIAEDPVTGSAHCALVPFWAARLGKPVLQGFQASQRGGELRCTLAGDRVELEGGCAFYLEGEIWLTP